MPIADLHACWYTGTVSREASALRSELRQFALRYAEARGIPFYESIGAKKPVVLFSPVDGRHGNFLDASYQAIQRNPKIRGRLGKRHAGARRALPKRFQDDACEMDSSNSSDALLMNIFCYPEVGRSRVRDVLGLRQWTHPVFGVRFRLAGEPEGPRLRSQVDRRTEIDMTFSTDLAVEAKPTEAEFQQAADASVMRYRHLEEVFAVQSLPRCKKGFDSYQLIRNILAAHERGGRFVVLYDRRRPDLLDRWNAVMRAIRIPALRERCAVLTWQQIAVAVPDELRLFLVEKYGIG
jgi:hypothetical protein